MDVRAVVPVNLRADADPATLGNRFGLVFLPLPIGPASPLERLRELKHRMDRIKRSAEAMVVYTLLRVFGATSGLVEAGVVRLLGSKATAVMTNVPGPREHLYLCGSRIDDVVFWVPQSGGVAPLPSPSRRPQYSVYTTTAPVAAIPPARRFPWAAGSPTRCGCRMRTSTSAKPSCSA
jgi:hypothetical protein